MKKNVLKKFAAAALAAATVMSSMSVMAFADDTGATANTGSVTITKYEGSTQDYEKLEDHYGAEQSLVSGEKLNNVEFAYIAVGDRVQVDVTDTDGKMTTEMLYTLSAEAVKALGLKESDKIKESGETYYRMSTLNDAIKNKKDDVIALVKGETANHTGANTKEKGKGKTSGEGTIEFDNLSLEKLYLFAETDATAAKKVSDGKAVAVTKVSVPFFVSLPFTDASGNSVKNIYAYPKNSTGTATIDKRIVEGSEEKVKTTANIGETINYKVTYSIPVGEKGLESLVVTDKMSKGLTFVNNEDDITVLNGNEKVDKKLYTVVTKEDNSTKATTITITFDSEGYCKKLDPNKKYDFTITYKATLNENAVLGRSGNTNDVFVTYKNTGDVERNTDHKDTKVFTYGIDLLKKGEGTEEVLVGVKFNLTDGNDKAVYVEKKTSNDFYTPGGSSNEVETDANGKIYIRGLKPGTYKLTETKTKDGYVLLKNPVVIVITQKDAETGEAEATVGSNKTVAMQNDQKNETSATAEVPLTVVNSKGFDLPATGGRGIALFTIAGIAIVAAAGSLLFMRKRSK